MKKSNGLPGIAGLISLVFTLCASLFPIGTGLILSMPDGTSEGFSGYDFVFGNNAAQIISNGAMIAFFVLLLVAALFQLLGTIFGWYGGKFTAFLHVVAGICLAICALLLFLSPIIIGAWVAGDSVALGYGFIVAGAASSVSALISLVVGVRGLAKK